MEPIALEDLSRGILAGFAKPEFGILDARPARAEDFGDEEMRKHLLALKMKRTRG
jgi:hypothetical protein